MADLRAQIHGLRRQNVKSLYFVPDGTLKRVITEPAVLSAIEACEISPGRRDEIVERVTHGGRRLFATLTLINRPVLILKFIENDQLIPRGLDSSLPFSLPTLQDILPTADADDFFEKQWEFTAPVLSRCQGHRILNEHTRFPFMDSTLLEEGGFGKVFEVEVHPDHGDFVGMPPNQVKIICKVLKQRSPQDTDDFNREINVLSFLNCIDHPNIVELLGSYTCQGSHNLVFPPASGDLQKLLDSNEPPGDFQSDADFVAALHGLASAIEKLHNYTLGPVEVEFIGCHRDLKPKNILVERGKFLLADFGLSALKTITEDSKSIFRAGPGWYMAPECEDAENEHKPGKIGRASDIWSFGCIICELATYMTHGSNGIREFQERRTVSLGSIRTKTFHAGKSPHTGVEDWVEKLDKSASDTTSCLLQLARRMLAIEPTERPKAEEVMLHLRQLTLTSRFLDTKNVYEEYEKKAKSLELTVEKVRYSLWGWALGFPDHLITAEIHDSKIIEVDTVFERNIQTLCKIGSKLTSHNETSDHLHALPSKLRMLNDEMASTLPLSLQKSIQKRLELRMVNTEDLGLLKEIKQTFGADSANRSIGVLAAVRYMNALCAAPPDNVGRDLQLQAVTLRNHRPFKGYELANMVKDNDDQREPSPQPQILVERFEYGESCSQSDVCKEYSDRMEAIAHLLHTASEEPAFKVLRCLGYHHEPQNHAFALVFEPPTAIYDGHGSTNLMSLEQLIAATQENGPQRPNLDERLKLAHSLAATVSAIHRANWLHKSISPSKVLFFVSQPLAVSESLPSPYLIGFNRSRPGDDRPFSVKPDTNDLYYQHPDYSDPQSNYQPKYDDFSLGVILLEIGLWKNLKKMLQLPEKDRLEPQEIMQPIMQDWVPRLGFYVGKSYHNVVTTCLTGSCETGGLRDSNDSHAPRLDSFETKVVEELQSLAV
ncbi:MAG: hypothetical protein Q9181_007303 [Wetmoreana brouardii]